MIWNRSMIMHFMLFSLAILSISTTKISQAATDTLLPTQSISDWQILVSANNTFVLGFFSPSNSSSNRYLGIWYYNIPELTVVWVANRDAPIADASGVLSFTDDGNLMISDARGSVFQFTLGSATNSTSATIMGSGNLILRDMGDASVLWQSFDHPTDHFLPGMLLGMKGKQNRFLTSWKSSDDPSSGDFSLGANPNRTQQLFIWQGHDIHWDTGVWNGHNFSKVPEMTRGDAYSYGYTLINGDEYFTYSLDNEYVHFRWMLDSTGHIKQLAMVPPTRDWIHVWSEPMSNCHVYNFCGDFGICSNIGTDSVSCECLRGFEPGSLVDWGRGVRTGGCLRKTTLHCNGSGTGGKPDRFFAKPNIKFPIYETELDIPRAKECESACLNNCNCTAYAFTDTCLLWSGKLVSVQQVYGYESLEPKTGTLFVRLAASEFRGNRRKLIVIIVTSLSLCLILIGCFLWWRCAGKSNDEQTLLLLGADIVNNIGINDSKGPDFTIFSFSHIAESTDNFSDANKLGEGGFGPVYKGILAEGHEIAVKRLSARSGQGLEEFKNEILLIAKLQHRNLVRLLGCCIQREEKILVYEYMPNKSLDFFLFGAEQGAQLEWGRRFNIIEGISQGLLYLHKHSRLRIIHRDLKASNILLDAEMNPKISDFGMARIFALNETEANTIKVVGTHGYISPEYAAEGLFSIKSDVFSFGVLLLEIVSGKRNNSFHQSMDYVNLLGYAWQLWKEGRLLELMDPLLGDNNPRSEISRCLHVGLLCVQESAIDRPTMTGVITMLSSENITLPNPKQPGFFTLRTVAREDLSSNICASASLNSVTITAVDGR